MRQHRWAWRSSPFCIDRKDGLCQPRVRLVDSTRELRSRAKIEENVPVLDLLGHRQEGLLDVGGLLGRRLEERNAERVCKLLNSHIHHPGRYRSVSLGKAKETMTLKRGRTFAAACSTTFLATRSFLFPTSSLLTPSTAYRSISCSHCLTLVKVSNA